MPAAKDLAQEQEKDGAAGQWAPRAVGNREAGLVVASEAKRAGERDLVLGAARALAECRAAVEHPECEREFRPQQSERAQAQDPPEGLAPEASQVGVAADQEAGRASRE